MQTFVYFFTYVVLVFVDADENILCTSKICDDVKCPALRENCKIQNSTHNGIFFPSPDTCNCCEYCLENLNEGDFCGIGSPASGTPTSICGFGLYCQALPKNDYDGTCQKMETDCMVKQADYDERRKNGDLGSMEVRQECDYDGLFVSYNCVPGQSCYCVDEKGNRIFGEVDFTSLPEVDLPCRCSRDYVLAVELIGRELNPNEHFRCTAKGDYDTFQHIRNKFLCVDSSDGAPTFPNDPLLNSSSITELKCYHEGDGDVYFKKCEKEYNDTLTDMQQFEYDMSFGFTYPKCDIDGTYQAVQENSTHKMCVDKQGNVLQTVDKKNKSLADSMDCKCTRAIRIMTTDEKPTCAENGNYEPTQCRRGMCRCVDRDGNQVCTEAPCEVEEVSKATLGCK